MENPTVEYLRQNKYKVRVTQRRYAKNKNGNQGKLARITEIAGPQRHPRGGEMRVDITAPDGQDYSATVRCVKEDQFNRKTGLYMAIKRAFENPVKSEEVSE
jgi:hypothetical protein